MTDVHGKRVLVVGLARSGLAVVRGLSHRGAVVTVTDLRPPTAFSKIIPELLTLKVGMELGLHRETTFLQQDLIVVSPGVPADLPALILARKSGVPVVPEVEAASWFLEGKWVGVTGTNGKTTTTSLLGKIFEASGFRTFVGGNIGVPLMSAVDQIPPPAVVVSELSSFQLETVQSFRPHVAVLLNVSPNHLDRHPSFEAYMAAKARIFHAQTSEDYAVLNADDERIRALAPQIRSQKVYFSRRQELPRGVFISDGIIRYRLRNLEVPLMETRDVRLRGEFNLENVLAAAAAACLLGAEFASVRRAVRRFTGVEHRLEFVREILRVAFYNDSKATSVDAAANALSTFDGGVHLILGGKDKGAPYAPLRSLLKDRVREVLVIGAAQKRIARELSGAADIVMAGDLEKAVRRAFARAEVGDVVLLAPACSSFDQFENFEHRGRVFKELVAQLAEETKILKLQPVPEGHGRRASDRVAPLPSNSSRNGIHERFACQDEAADRSGPHQSSEPVRRELEYIYEVSAEEAHPTTEFDLLEGPAHEAPFDFQESAPPQQVEDEALSFEIRPPSSAKGGKPSGARRRLWKKTAQSHKVE